MSGAAMGRKPGRTELRVQLVFVAILALAMGAIVWSALRDAGPAEPPTRVLTLYGFSVLGEAMQDGVFPAFREEWLRRKGEHVELVATFAASGRIVDEILREVPVQVAVLASEIDAERLAARGLLYGRPWGALPHGGVLCRSPLVMITRAGNPLGLRGWSDLAGDGISVVLPDPRTSGAGEWVLASLIGCTEGEEPPAERFLRNVALEPPSAREALAAFLRGAGDALPAYEQQARSLPPGDAEVVYPPCTAVVEPLVVTIGRNVDEKERELVDAFVEFLWSAPAQQALAAHGFRPADAELRAGEGDLAGVERLLTVESLGGARAIEQRLPRKSST
jgi:sulfate transport system substrate-binding protein